MRNIALVVLLCVLEHIAGQDTGSGDGDVDIVDGSGASDLDLSEASGEYEIVVEHSVSYTMSSQSGGFSIRFLKP